MDSLNDILAARFGDHIADAKKMVVENPTDKKAGAPVDNFKKRRPTNTTFLLAADIAKLTATQPQRWLREVKNDTWAANRAYIELKELKANGGVRNPYGYYLYLLNKYKTPKKPSIK